MADYLVSAARVLRGLIVVVSSMLLVAVTWSVAQADAVIGTGTPASCQTEAAANALGAAVLAGGTITFDCGPDPAQMIVNTNATDKVVVVDGGGKITLSGDDQRQIFYVFGGGELTLNNISLFDGNNSTGGALAVIGAGSRATINRSFLVSNRAELGKGGAVYVDAGTLEISDSVLGANRADQDGGAIYNNGGTVTLSRTTLRNNEATQNGGGLYSAGGSATVTNTTVAENRALGGGGLYLSGGATTTLLNTTLSLNRADTGAALWNFAGQTETQNSIFSASRNLANTASALNCDGPTLTTRGHNIVDDATCVPNPGSLGDLTGTDPELGPLRTQGGLGATFLPLAGSPAINGGDNSGCPSTDQRGVPRPLGPRCDVGATEFGALAYLPVIRRP